jgi:hypothetical protein
MNHWIRLRFPKDCTQRSISLRISLETVTEPVKKSLDRKRCVGEVRARSAFIVLQSEAAAETTWRHLFPMQSKQLIQLNLSS